MQELAPWDAHLVRLKVHPNAPLVGESLAKSQMRKQFGISVVAIQRGLRLIVAPKPEQTIFPKDELLVLGTDDQIDRLRPMIERPPGLDKRFSGAHSIEGYRMRNFFVAPDSLFSHRTIREAAFREEFGILVVGIEREQRRILNPDSNLRLIPGDIIWVVGENEKLDRLTERCDTCVPKDQ